MENRTCPQCGAPVERRRPTGPLPIYCSNDCKRVAHQARCRADGRHDQQLARMKADYRPTNYRIRCALCDKEFTARRSNNAYCSTPCRNAGNPRRCSEAGCSKPHRANGLCSTHYNDQAYGDSRYRKQKGNCAHCGETFDVRRKGQRFCSILCRSGGELQVWTEDERRQWREAQRRRRARLREIEVEQFTDREIYERDGWRCQLCRKPVDQALAWPHPMSATLDHIIPMTEHGTSHTQRNVRLAHLVCNTRRSNRGGDEQLALI